MQQKKTTFNIMGKLFTHDREIRRISSIYLGTIFMFIYIIYNFPVFY